MDTWHPFHLLTGCYLLFAACSPLSKSTTPPSAEARGVFQKNPPGENKAKQAKAGAPLVDRIHAYLDEYGNEIEIGRFRGDLLLARDGVPLVQIAKFGDYGRRFMIGSITKSMTAVAVMQLVEQGRVQLNDSIRTYIPELLATHDKMTIDQLLGHRSGLGNYTDDVEFVKQRFAPISQAKMIEHIARAPIIASPGQRFLYSNSGYYLLGLVIERISGMPWENYLSKHIWEPAGMHHTSTKLEGLATGLKLEHDSLAPARIADGSFCYASGAIVSTADDLLKFGLALRSGTILNKERIEQMWTPGKVEQGRNNYGYGFVVSRLADGRRIVKHSGGVDGFISDWAMTDDGQWLGVVLANTETVLSAKVNYDVMRMALAHDAEDGRPDPGLQSR